MKFWLKSVISVAILTGITFIIFARDYASYRNGIFNALNSLIGTEYIEVEIDELDDETFSYLVNGFDEDERGIYHELKRMVESLIKTGILKDEVTSVSIVFKGKTYRSVEISHNEWGTFEQRKEFGILNITYGYKMYFKKVILPTFGGFVTYSMAFLLLWNMKRSKALILAEQEKIESQKNKHKIAVMVREEREKKYEVMRTLSGRLAHDVLNDVQASRDGFETIKEIMDDCEEGGGLSLDESDYDEIKESMEVISICTNRMIKFISDIVKMTRKKMSKKNDDASAVDVKKCIEDCIKIFKRKIDVENKLYVKLSCPNPHITYVCNTWYDDLSSGILNVLNNSIQAMDKEDKLIKISIAASYVHTDNDVDVKKFITINIWDNGSGIPASRIGDIFEPFKTFDKDGGSGIGLSSLSESVHKSSGEVSATSEEGQWTNIKITLPAYAKEVE